MRRHYDLAVFGSGFAGSLIAMIARRLGLSVVLLEKGRHPRVVIGESSTPLSNLLLETLADRYDLPLLKQLTKWGTWQRSYPQVACGLKRGFTFFHHESVEQAVHGDARARQLLVAASPNDAIADTHWFRADFDQLLLQQACDLGVDLLEECSVFGIERDRAHWAVTYRHRELSADLQASFLIDATGPRGLLHGALGLGERALPNYPKTAAIYSHFKGVKTFAGQQHYAAGSPPYPPDAAALHHVFDGGWVWILHFNNGWTSAGCAATAEVAERYGFAEKEAGWVRLLESLPEVKQQFADAEAVMPFTYVPRLAFRSEAMAGPGWALLPSAAGFVDPLLSTGFPLTLLGLTRLGAILERKWGTPELESSLARYAAETEAELLTTSQLIGALYANMGDFATFRQLSLLYFAAASYAETARRLDKSALAETFLLGSHEVFGPGMRELVARARRALSSEQKIALQDDILALIERFDVAGLCQRPLDHCYPVRAADLFAGARKVHASAEEIERLLERTGFKGASA